MEFMKKNYPVIVFDFGGVLLDWNPRYLYQKLFDGNVVAMETFLNEIGFAAWNLEQDKGRPFTEGVALLSKQFPHYAALIHAYHERWEESILGAISGSVEILRVLKKQGYPLLGLSNWSSETFQRVRSRYEFLDWFDGIVLSGEVKLVKPDPRIYGLLLDKAGVSAELCLFIDDSLVNVTTAKQLGFMTIYFESSQQLKKELSERGILD
jgi:2-haloacid dehalogenase